MKKADAAHVFRYAGGKEWTDCGRLGTDPNHLTVQSMIVHDDKIYAGTGIWDWMQARNEIEDLPPAAPTRVFVYEGGAEWRDLGQVGEGSRDFTPGRWTRRRSSSFDVFLQTPPIYLSGNGNCRAIVLCAMFHR